VLVASTALQSTAFGALPVGVAALTADRHVPALAGALQVMLTVGGLLGTLLPAPPGHRSAFVRLLAAFAGALVPVSVLATWSAVGALLAIGAALLLAGLFLTPVAAAAYTLVQRDVINSRRTEAFAWLSTGQASGTGLGALIGGFSCEQFGPVAGLAVLPLGVAVGALMARLLPA
jgi:MFS family permease